MPCRSRVSRRRNQVVNVDLSVSIGSLRLRNPLIAASGCFGYGTEYADLVDLSSLGGVAVKGIVSCRTGGPPAAAHCRNPAGMLNAIGLQGIGVHRFISEKMPELRARGAVVIVNICGTTLQEYVELARILSDVEGVAALELQHLVPQHQGGRHHVRLQPPRDGRRRRCRSRCNETARDSQADAERHRHQCDCQRG